MKFKFIIISIGIILIIGCSSNPTSPEGNSFDIIWKKADSPIVIDSCFVVPPEQTLKIEPGVVIKFKSSQYIDIYDKPIFDFDFETLDIGMLLVRGRIIAEGTTEDSIRFTRYENSGKWGILLLKDSENNILNNCILEHSNYIINFENNTYVGAISLHNSSATITKNLILDNEYDGIESWSSNNVNIAFNEFHRNRRGVYCKSSYNIVENNYFLDNSRGIHCFDNSSPDIISNVIDSCGRGVVCFDYSNPNITNCIIKYCSDGIYLENYSNPYIVNNLIMNNSSDGIDCVDDECNPEIINNTIVNNNYYGIARSMGTNPNIINNLFWDNGTSSIRFFENYSNPVISYSLLQESNIPLESDGGNNIFNQNPFFINPDTENYQLLENSPCINQGLISDLLNLPNLDVIGNLRISGTSIDIGAYEFQE